MDRLFSDLRHGFRLLTRTPGVTITALAALALAIGANSAMFSVVDAVLLRPLPYEDADRVVMVWEDASKIGFPRNTPAPANWQDWLHQNTVFTDIAATRGMAYSLTGDGQPERVPARRVTSSLWTVLGTKPRLGRTFTEGEERQNAKVAVIGYGLWQRRYGADPNIVGRKVLLTDEPFTVIGVMPAAFSFPSRRTEIWTPAAFTPQDLQRRGSHFLQCVARLRPGVSIRQAQAEMRVIAKRLEERYPQSNRNVGAIVVPMTEQVTDSSRTGLVVLFAASAFVLLIACANIANLLLARATAREREIAVRAALGANRGTILRQLLTESLMLAGLGALLGIVLSRLAMQLLEKLVPLQMAATKLELDWRVLLFTVAVTVATGVLFGVFPAFNLGRVQVQEALKQGGRTASTGGSHRLRELLVVSQTALALALLTGAGLMIQTLHHLQRVDLGLRTDHLLTMSTELARNTCEPHARCEAFFNSVVSNVESIPGVVAAGYSSDLPLTAMGNTSGYVLQGQTSVEANSQDALFRVVTPGFLPAIGARLREGRLFTKDDRAGTLPVVIVNETFAGRHWRGQRAAGRQISIDRNDPRWLTVVGVVKEIRERGITAETKPAVYMPLAQSEGYWPVPADLAIHTSVEPESILAAVRQAIGAVNPGQPVSDIRTMEQVVDEQLSREHQQTSLLAAFAGLALVLAVTGIYGVISYAVSQRRREIGVRIALGASQGMILHMVLGRGLGLIAVGLMAGAVLSLIASRMLKTLLFGVADQDPLTLAGAACVLLLAALAACAVPARSASRVDPMTVLREE